MIEAVELLNKFEESKPETWFHNIKSNDIDLGGDINLQMISPLSS